MKLKFLIEDITNETKPENNHALTAYNELKSPWKS